jgi:hypothetical protein
VLYAIVRIINNKKNTENNSYLELDLRQIQRKKKNSTQNKCHFYVNEIHKY